MFSTHGGGRFARFLLSFTREINNSSTMARQTRSSKKTEETIGSGSGINNVDIGEGKGENGGIVESKVRKAKGKNQSTTSPYFDADMPKSSPPEAPEDPDVVSDAFQTKKRVAKPKKSPVKIAYETSKRKSQEPDQNGPPSKEIKWEPENWRVLLENIREMRKSKDAPVDSMGCDQCKDGEAPPEVTRYHALISLMLSSQTKDQVTHAAVMRLREHGLTIENILKTDDQVLEDLIHPVGFKKTKVKYIKRTSEILRDQYNGDIPDTVEKLCSLPGVGPKMAHLCMNSAWGIVTGIGVDTHVHRIANRLGWLQKPTKVPEDTRKGLESWLPEPLWDEVNHLLVGFGQQTCRPVGPQCDRCLNKSICPFGKTQSPKSPKKKSKK